MYGPCVLLVVISWVSFWLNREATSDRITLGEDKRRKKMQKKMGKRWRGKSCLFFSRRRGNENEEGSAPRPEPSTGKGKGLEGYILRVCGDEARNWMRLKTAAVASHSQATT